MALIWIVAGFALLIKGADWFVEGSSALARRLRVPNLVIGLTVVAFGTSAPELAVNVTGALRGESGIVLGNVVGSNLFNILAILGVVGLIRPMRVTENTVWYEIPFTMGALLLTWLLLRIGGNGELLELSRADGAILLLGFIGFFVYIQRSLKRTVIREAEGDGNRAMKPWKLVVFMGIGLGALLWGGQLVVKYATDIALQWGISSRIIGLTIVAIGTSLPELVTSSVAALKKNSDIAMGNVLGSNIFNLLFVLSASVLVRPVTAHAEIELDLAVLAAGTVLLFAYMFVGGRRTLTRWEAVTLLAIYLVYTLYLVGAFS